MPERSRPPRLSRPAALLVGGAALLACLGVTQAFLPVLRRSPGIDARPPAPSHRIHDFTTHSPPPFAARPVVSRATEPATLATLMELASAGRFAAALAGVRDLPEDQAPAALASLFAIWTRQAPGEAAAAALGLDDPAARDRAWQTVVATWSAAAPAALAAHSLTLPEGSARRQSLDAAITGWLALDAPAAMDWVGRLPSGPETDGAVALVAQHPDLLNRQPDLALDWAESIRDPALRSRVLGRVVRAWRDSAPAALAAAEHYARTSPDLLPSEREDILVGERFTAHP